MKGTGRDNKLLGCFCPFLKAKVTSASLQQVCGQVYWTGSQECLILEESLSVRT